MAQKEPIYNFKIAFYTPFYGSRFPTYTKKTTTYAQNRPLITSC